MKIKNVMELKTFFFPLFYSFNRSEGFDVQRRHWFRLQALSKMNPNVYPSIHYLDLP